MGAWLACAQMLCRWRNARCISSFAPPTKESMSGSFRKIPIEVAPAKPAAEQEVVSLYAAQKKIYPRSVHGRFNNWRVVFVVLTQLVFLGLPWLRWDGRQAVNFDLVERKFYLLGLIIWPQDFIYLAALLIISAFGLFLWTTIAGRLWCGYSCPQTVYTEIMLWIEQWSEGSHIQRSKLDKQGWSVRKLRIKLLKHSLMLAFSLLTGFTLVGYFTPIHDLLAALPRFDYGPWELFWIFFYAACTYLLAGVMREQVCQYMCPYARFQSVMFDADTLVISYDAARGEPRGARKKGSNPQEQGLGSCINCNICVQVCPAGIDIRNGLQHECIGCAACIDACDEVMDKMAYPRGLIRYTTESALEGLYPDSAILSRLRRPRVVLYALLLLVATSAAGISFALRKPFKVDVIRDRASLVQETSDGRLENSYMLNIINTTSQDQVFSVSVSGLPEMAISSPQRLSIKSADSKSLAVRVVVDPQYADRGSHPILFRVQSVGNPALVVEEKSSFIGE